MDRLFSSLTKKYTPSVNPEVMDGLACIYMKKVEEYLHKIIASASVSFPPGLEYVGCERCSPYDEYNEITKVKNNKRIFDLAKSDLYLIKFKFKYNGIPLHDRYIYIPYVNDGGIFSLGGAKYHITPVLSDKVISPGMDSIFVRLLRDKIIFKRCYHAIVIDDVREISHVIWSRIHRKTNDNKKVPQTTKALTTVPHYLFAKFGFTETFRKYCGSVPVIGEEEITIENYPRDKWIICESSQVRPKNFMGSFYEPSKIKLAIPRDKWNNITKGLVVGFFYVVDYFPTRFKPGYVDNTSLWMILLGHIVFSGHYGENKLFTQINDHFISLNSYVDVIIVEKLKENNYHINDFYDLLALIINNFNNLVLDKESSSLSMYGKNLEILYYVLYDITAGLFKVIFKLNELSNKKPLTDKDVNKTFNTNMKMGAIYGLSSGKIITESVSYSGDHKYPKITSKITEQESLPGANRGKSKRLVVGEDKHLHMSMVEAGSILFLSKSNPAPTTKINPFVTIELATGTVIPNPKFKDILQRTQDLLTNQTS